MTGKGDEHPIPNYPKFDSKSKRTDQMGALLWDLWQNEYINIAIRAISVYLFMLIALRIFGKKELAQLSVVDLVFILLISNAVQNAMIGPDTSLSGGIIAAASLFAANYTLKKVLYKNRGFNRLLQGNAVSLIYKGKINELNLKKAQISLQELEAVLREHGLNSPSDVDLAMLEVDGNVSIVSNNFQNHSTKPLPRHKKQHIDKKEGF